MVGIPRVCKVCTGWVYLGVYNGVSLPGMPLGCVKGYPSLVCLSGVKRAMWHILPSLHARKEQCGTYCPPTMLGGEETMWHILPSHHARRGPMWHILPSHHARERGGYPYIPTPVPWWPYYPSVYRPAYAPRVHHAPSCVPPSASSLVTGCTLRSDGPWGSVWENQVGGSLSEG